jgi:hypothetical protein
MYNVINPAIKTLNKAVMLLIKLKIIMMIIIFISSLFKLQRDEHKVFHGLFSVYPWA